MEGQREASPSDRITKSCQKIGYSSEGASRHKGLLEWITLTLSISDPSHLSQRQLESTLWSAANALRGPVDPGDFKAYVFPVMFFKWISDSWDHEHAQALEDFGDALTDEIEVDYHTFVIPDGCHWADVIETTQQTGVKRDNALQRIQQANPDALITISLWPSGTADSSDAFASS